MAPKKAIVWGRLSSLPSDGGLESPPQDRLESLSHTGLKAMDGI